MKDMIGNRRRSIGLKMSVLARQMRQRFDERVELLGITRTKWMLIAAVAAHPGATQREIAEQLQVTDVTAGRLIDQLCADGLLQRRDSLHDRRAYSVVLTPAAQPVRAQLGKAAEAYEADIFSSFDEEELELLDRLLGKLSDSLCSPRRAGTEKGVAVEDVAVITLASIDAA